MNQISSGISITSFKQFGLHNEQPFNDSIKIALLHKLVMFMLDRYGQDGPLVMGAIRQMTTHPWIVNKPQNFKFVLFLRELHQNGDGSGATTS